MDGWFPPGCASVDHPDVSLADAPYLCASGLNLSTGQGSRFAGTSTRWLLKEVPTRLPGRIDAAATSFGSTSDLTAPADPRGQAHGGRRPWPDWYAATCSGAQSGADLLL